MSLSGGFLHIVKTELIEKKLIGSRVDKIHQPSRDEIVITLRVAGNYERLLFSANSMSARVCLTSAAPENPMIPPMFCLVLRKHIGNGRLKAISQEGLERVLNFDFLCINEIGDAVNNRLIIEIMGRTSNIILINADTGRIIDSIKRINDEMSSVRMILPNLEYKPPLRDKTRHCLLDCDVDNIEWSLNDKVLLKQLEGVSPLFVREAIFHDSTKEFLNMAKTALIKNKPQITLISDLDGKPLDFCFMPIKQYGSSMLTSCIEQSVSVTENLFCIAPANKLLDSFFNEKAGVERLKQRSGNIMKSLNTAYERLLRKVEIQKSELAECKVREQLRIYGDLINANIYKINKGDSVLETEDYTTGLIVRIKLDLRLTPSQNAQKYYSAYRKLSNAEKKLTELITEGEQELVYLNSVIDLASRAVTDIEIDAIREEIGKSPGKNSVKARNNAKAKKQAKPKPLSPLKFIASDGTEILVGRNNKQNDELTFKIAKSDDIWLHTKDIAGSHIILKCSGQIPGIEIITEAAVIAAEHSQGRESSRVPVDYTFVKFVKKPNGSKPGYVIFTNNKTLYVNPRSRTGVNLNSGFI
jgi:predicted ribosome quality control (RQC) complex YloA/Tae2 family protein